MELVVIIESPIFTFLRTSINENMSTPAIIEQIQDDLKLAFKFKRVEIDLSKRKEGELKPVQEQVQDFMRYGVKDDPECQYKYLMHQDRIIGLCLRSTPTVKTFSYLQNTELQGLRALKLTENSLALLELPAVLQALQYLDVSDNIGLQSLTFEKGLSNLKSFDASDSGLTEIHFPMGFDSLEKIDISRNKLAKCDIAENIPKLTTLDLSGNELVSFTLLDGFETLRFLYLAGNKLETISFPQSLPKLKTLNLRQNQLYKKEWPIDFLDAFPLLETLYINENPMPDAIRLIVDERGRQNQLVDVKNYLVEMAKGVEKDNEVKVLVLGNGNVGKTCFVQRLVHKKKIKKWNSTHAINLEEFPYKDYLLNLWDFGGQDIYFATHRLFMQSNAIYLVLWDLTTATKAVTPIEENGTIVEYNNYNLSYWLDYAKIQGWDKRKKTHSPLIVVETKVNPQLGNTPPGFKKKNWQGIFPYFHSSIPIDSLSEEDTGFDILLMHIGKAIRSMENDMDIPESYWKLRKAIRDLQQLGEEERPKSISLKEYLELAIDLEDSIPVLEHWLTKTGVVFYQKGMFKDQIILDQKWAIDAVYALFRRIPPDKRKKREQHYVYKDWLSKNGRFSGKDLGEIWYDYEENEQRLFLDFMLSCKMCFEIKQAEKDRYIAFKEKLFIAPQLLPLKRPDNVTKQEELWREKKDSPLLFFKYTHDFLHYGIIQNFIFDTHHLAETEKSIWRNGILIRYKGISALVEIRCKEETDKHLYHEIWVKVAPEGKALLDIIRNNLEQLLGDGFTEWGSVDGVEWKELAVLEKDLVNYSAVIQQKYSIFFNKNEKATFDKEEREDSKKANQTRGVVLREKLPRPEKRIIEQKMADNAKSFTPLEETKELIKLLFLAASPMNQGQLNTGSESRFKDLIKEFDEEKRIEFREEHGLTSQKFQNILFTADPHIVHYGGHGFKEGIFLEDKELDGDLLVRLLEDADNAQCVVLNACNTLEIAKKVAQYVPYVIATCDVIDDAVAIAFAKGFYVGIAAGKTVEKSFKHGIRIAESEGLENTDVLVLVKGIKG